MSRAKPRACHIQAETEARMDDDSRWFRLLLVLHTLAVGVLIVVLFFPLVN